MVLKSSVLNNSDNLLRVGHVVFFLHFVLRSKGLVTLCFITKEKMKKNTVQKGKYYLKIIAFCPQKFIGMDTMVYCFAPRCSHQSSESHTCKFFAFPSNKKEKDQYKQWIRRIRFVLSFFLKEHHKIWNAEVILTKCLMNNCMQCLAYGY